MVKGNKSKLECLLIDNKIINLNCDWNMKSVLGYIQFRLNLKKFDWTFCQADVVRQLGLDKSMVSRIFKCLILANVLKYECSVIKRHLELKKYSINVESFNAYISQSHSESVTVSGCNSDSLTVRVSQSQDETYNKDTKQIFENNDNEKKEAVSPAIIGKPLPVNCLILNEAISTSITSCVNSNPETIILNKAIESKQTDSNIKKTPKEEHEEWYKSFNVTPPPFFDVTDKSIANIALAKSCTENSEVVVNPEDVIQYILDNESLFDSDVIDHFYFKRFERNNSGLVV